MKSLNRSNLSHYLKSLRLRKGYSVEYTAGLLNISAVTYISIEEAPAKAPSYTISEIMKIFSASYQEWEDFHQLMAEAIVIPLPTSASTENPFQTQASDGPEDDNILSMDGQRSLPTRTTDPESGEKS